MFCLIVWWCGSWIVWYFFEFWNSLSKFFFYFCFSHTDCNAAPSKLIRPPQLKSATRRAAKKRKLEAEAQDDEPHVATPPDQLPPHLVRARNTVSIRTFFSRDRPAQPSSSLLSSVSSSSSSVSSSVAPPPHALTPTPLQTLTPCPHQSQCRKKPFAKVGKSLSNHLILEHSYSSDRAEAWVKDYNSSRQQVLWSSQL